MGTPSSSSLSSSSEGNAMCRYVDAVSAEHTAEGSGVLYSAEEEGDFDSTHAASRSLFAASASTTNRAAEVMFRTTAPHTHLTTRMVPYKKDYATDYCHACEFEDQSRCTFCHMSKLTYQARMPLAKVVREILVLRPQVSALELSREVALYATSDEFALHLNRKIGGVWADATSALCGPHAKGYALWDVADKAQRDEVDVLKAALRDSEAEGKRSSLEVARLLAVISSEAEAEEGLQARIHSLEAEVAVLARENDEVREAHEAALDELADFKMVVEGHETANHQTQTQWPATEAREMQTDAVEFAEEKGRYIYEDEEEFEDGSEEELVDDDDGDEAFVTGAEDATRDTKSIPGGDGASYHSAATAGNNNNNTKHPAHGGADGDAPAGGGTAGDAAAAEGAGADGADDEDDDGTKPKKKKMRRRRRRTPKNGAGSLAYASKRPAKRLPKSEQIKYSYLNFVAREPSAKGVQNLAHSIYEIFEKKMSQDEHVYANGQRPDPLSRGLRSFWRQKLGIKKMAQRRMADMVNACRTYADQSTRVLQFAWILGLDVSTVDPDFFWSPQLSRTWFAVFFNILRIPSLKVGSVIEFFSNVDEGDALVEREQFILALMGKTDPIKHHAVQRADPKTWRNPELTLIMNDGEIFQLLAAIDAAPNLDHGTGQHFRCIDLDATMLTVLRHAARALNRHAVQLTENFFKFDMDSPGLSITEFSNLCVYALGEDRYTDEQRNRLHEDIEDLCDDDDDDNQGSIDNGHGFAIACMSFECDLAYSSLCRDHWSH